MHQANRNSLTRSSYASFATLSLFEQSTKRTSLLPSSTANPTPRGSFLCSPAVDNEPRGNTLVLPNMMSAPVKAHVEADEEDQVFTLQVPVPVPVQMENREAPQDGPVEVRRESMKKEENAVPFDVVAPFEFMSQMMLQSEAPKPRPVACPPIEESSNENESSNPQEQDYICSGDENLSEIYERKASSQLEKRRSFSKKFSLVNVLKPLKEEQAMRKNSKVQKTDEPSISDGQKDEEYEESSETVDDIFGQLHKIVLAEEEQRIRRQSNSELISEIKRVDSPELSPEQLTSRAHR
ncbi:hypothetical protein Ciccas_013849 [Cichlidogyrus casuarinus]|uniref:Uncharacterized protein n=1 Tax=Cichlidogyrus casuarinus TaxID=1844966 RepID=A0ABD2PKQ7_9PLAT